MNNEHEQRQRREATDLAAALLATAQSAAAARDAIGMVEALYASGYLAGLKRLMQRKWGKLPTADVEDCVADAVNEAYLAVSSRRRVADLGAWLWKTADNRAADRWRRDHAPIRGLDEAPERYVPEPDDEERTRSDALDDFRRVEAVRLARRLLPSVGHGQIREVMTLVVDAVEAGQPDLPPAVVADTLGITAPAARSLMSRGLERLRAAARTEGLELPDCLPSETWADEDTHFQESDQ